MARFDKVEPKGGSFRAQLNFAIALADVGEVVAVGLDTNGLVVKGAGTTGIVAVICPSNVMAVGDPIDCMTDGEIVDVALDAGSTYFGTDADGAYVTPTAVGSTTKIGFTVQAWRLIVRLGGAA